MASLIWTDYTIKTDTSLLNETTPPYTNYDFSEDIPQETGITGLQYILYYNEQVMNDWSEYVQETNTDIANYYNVGNYDGKALRIIFENTDGMGSGDVVCLADYQVDRANYEDGALCLQWRNTSTVRTHRLTPDEWRTWIFVDVGTEGQVADPSLVDELPAYMQGAQDWESWEIFTCETIDANGFTCDVWFKTYLSSRDGYPRFVGSFGGIAVVTDDDATDNSLKRQLVEFTYEGANPIYTVFGSLVLASAVLQTLF